MKRNVTRVAKSSLVMVLVIILLTFTLTGCCDLGDFPSEEAYVNCFKNVQLIGQDVEDDKNDNSMSDFYSKDLVENYQTICTIDLDYYKYLVIEANDSDEMKDLRISDFAMFVYGTEVTSLAMTFFSVDSYPDFKKLTGYDRFFGRYLFETKYDREEWIFDGKGKAYRPEAPEQKYDYTISGPDSNLLTFSYTEFNTYLNTDLTTKCECRFLDKYRLLLGMVKTASYVFDEEEHVLPPDPEIEFNYVDTSLVNEDQIDVKYKVGEATVNLKENDWYSFLVDKWNGELVDEDGCFIVKKGGYIVVRFDNNCFGADRKKLEKTQFKATLLLMRTEDKEEVGG